MKRYLEIGKVNNTHGIKGEMKLSLWCDGIEFIKQFTYLYLDDKGNKQVRLLSVRPQKNIAIIKLEGVDSIDDAEKLKGKILYCDRNDAEIDENANYIADLIGCSVIDAENGEKYGTVFDVVNYGSCDIYDIVCGKKHFMIPAISDVVADINTSDGIIKINRMKGLFDED